MQTEILKKTIKEKIILDKEQQKIIAELDKTIDKLELELMEVKNIDKNHQRINGLLRKDVDKLTKENEYLKKENQVIREGNDYLGIFNQPLLDEIKKLIDDLKKEAEAGAAVVRRHPGNTLFLKAIQSLTRTTLKIQGIYKKITRKN